MNMWKCNQSSSNIDNSIVKWGDVLEHKWKNDHHHWSAIW
jgi:hypothetical protein